MTEHNRYSRGNRGPSFDKAGPLGIGGSGPSGGSGIVPAAAPNQTEWCHVCDRVRPLDELLEVVRVRTGERTYVCRPGEQGRCFQRVGPAEFYRIAVADRHLETR